MRENINSPAIFTPGRTVQGGACRADETCMTTLEQERRELWDGLLEGMRDSDDPDCAAACRRLLMHLVGRFDPTRVEPPLSVNDLGLNFDPCRVGM